METEFLDCCFNFHFSCKVPSNLFSVKLVLSRTSQISAILLKVNCLFVTVFCWLLSKMNLIFVLILLPFFEQQENPPSCIGGSFLTCSEGYFQHWKNANPQNPPRFSNLILNAADSCSVEGWKQHIQTGMWDHSKCLFEQQNVFFIFVPLLAEILMICVNTYGQHMCVLVHKVISSKRQGFGSAVEFHSKWLSKLPNRRVQLGWLAKEMMTFMC